VWILRSFSTHPLYSSHWSRESQRPTVLLATFRVHWKYGPCRRGGSAWQPQFARPQRVRRSRIVPDSTFPVRASVASSAAISSTSRSRSLPTVTPQRFPRGIHHRPLILLYIYRVNSGRVTTGAEAIARWSPTRCSPAAAVLARQVVAATAPCRPARARALLLAASRLFSFCESRGLELTPALLAPPVIERFVVDGCGGYSLATVRTMRANLRHLAASATACPAPPRLARTRAKAPYTAAELASLFALADAQPTQSRRRRIGAVLCLGAGAGLLGRELASVRGVDVVERSGGLVVLVGGGRLRAVPVRALFHRRLVALAAAAGGELLVGGVSPERKNVTAGLVASLAGGADLPSFDTGRLRSSFLVAACEEIGLRGLLEAAGISCPQRLGDLVRFCSPVGEPEAVALLGGHCPEGGW
jgi:hypothetical protein